MMLERTGVVAEAIAMRRRYAHYAWRPPVVSAPPRAPEVPASARALLEDVADILVARKKREPSGRSTSRKPGPSILDAVSAACEAFGSSRDLVLSRDRNQGLVRVRHAAFLLMRRECGMSLNAIGKALRRDHTTIMHGIKRAKQHIDENPWYRARYEHAVSLLRSM